MSVKYIFFIIYIILDLTITFYLTVNIPCYNVLIFLGLFFSSSIIPLFFIIKKISIFEPFFWFSIYYFVLIISEYIELYNNFSESIFIIASSFYENIHYLFAKTVWIVFIGYLIFSLTYFYIRPSTLRFNTKPSIESVSFRLIKFIASLSLIIALANFLFNLYILTKLDIWKYFSNLAYYSAYMKEYGLSSIGYNFIYVSIFFNAYLYLNKKIGKSYFWFNVLLFIVIILSLGRITNTITSILILYLVFLYYKNKTLYVDKKIMFNISIFFILAIFLFFYRMYTDFFRVYGLSWNEFKSIILPTIINILIGKGNLPNVGILMKIIDSWQEIGFLYGKSILLGFLVFLPSSISKELIIHNTVSWLSKFQWYTHIPGGSLPPTVIGDLFSNFGIIGVFTGMFMLGLLFSLIFKKIIKVKNYFIFVFYLFFLLKFTFILPKGEFSRLSFILVPTLLLITYSIAKLITIIVRRSKYLEKISNII